MKKQLLSLATGALLLFASNANAQYYTIGITGGNPKGVNAEGENPGAASGGPLANGWTSIWTGGAASVAAYSPITSIPFSFTFNGSAFTRFKASNSGSVTFDTASTIIPAYGNVALPSANVPDNSINILGVKPITNATYSSSIITKTFGTAPNRQFWIQYNFFSEANISEGWTYWAVVLEETSNKVYIVDMKTLCVTGGALCANNVKISAGLQMNSTTAYTIAGSPNLGANNYQTNLFDASDNKYYEFVNGTQPALDMTVFLVNNEALGLNKPTKIYGRIRNLGSQAVTAMALNYQLESGAVVSTNLSGLNIAASGGEYNFEHPTPLVATADGSKVLQVWASSINGGTDEVSANDKLTKNVIVAENLRRSFHEIFSSSTCGPCAPGNANYKSVVANRDNNLFVSVKYQQDFPGTGDPYSTTESVARRNYYAINSIPRMEVDGKWDQNASSFTDGVFNQFQAVPADIAIDATYKVFGKTVTVDIKLKSAIDLTGDLNKLHVAIIEGKTTDNLKSNGEREFYHVMKKMLPNQNGTTLTGGLTAGTEKSYTLSFEFPGNYRLAANGQNPINLATEHSVEGFDDLEVVVFVQNNTTKNVLQAANAERTAYYALGLAENANTINAAVYPNPASTSFAIAAPNAGRFGYVRVFDISGKEVVSNQLVEFNSTQVDVSGLNAGIYFVAITTDGVTATQKLVIAK
ncbi:MAG: T9SS type A sorting domain-containing protein [Bacteroidia bacterium]|nr:T9SS type A sorting domain-containing protein [Bacteroidia bacterium]MBP9688730.1 T9SS type A sorting domain-containing protein [Bacteroidia bacterium]